LKQLFIGCNNAAKKGELAMAKIISRSQALWVMIRVWKRVNWDEQNGLSPEGLDKRLAAFFRNGASVMVRDPKSVITRLFDPAEFLGQGWKTWKDQVDNGGFSNGEEDDDEDEDADADVDLRSLALSEIELNRFLFETFEKGEKYITRGEKKLGYLKEEKQEFIRFGGNVFISLWEDYLAYRKDSTLEWFYWNFGISFMDFFGQVLRGPHGDRCILDLHRYSNGQWNWGIRWLDHLWNAGIPAVGCVKF